MALKVKKGDTVVVLAGKNKGKQGVVIAAFPEKSKVIVEGVNVAKKHVRPSPQDAKGGIKSVELPIQASNVMLLDKSGNPVRTSRRPDASGKRSRVSKKTGEPV